MWWMLSMALFAVWLLGMVSSYTVGGFIHLFFLLAIAAAIAAVAASRRAASRGRPSITVSSQEGEHAHPGATPPPPAEAIAASPVERAAAAAIFLSYRRDDSADVVGRIYDRLTQHFGASHVFKDVDSIRLGVDFRDHLRSAVGQCRVVIAVVGPAWLSVSDPQGRRRLEDEKDYVRIEIEAAFGRGIPVVPVLVRGAVLPGEDQLPGGLGPLAFRNGIAVRSDPDFHKDMDRLVTGLEALM